ncbi:SsgA family sporulation/cell division regulator [Streptomyces sp. MBT53]|uniref:SsgA family sporulation/cell division regulator n=1 Tax=Streptomyces sp. MBT53 TaxID=1488384 RepID=UPI001911C381|nr:SsgA family sporulation/cell division regulator [Streptomyces sp. MBT53]MBK6014057.1 SsgA family sporulation/cell division regulator [Streptomyces sp. MBT53]
MPKPVTLTEIHPHPTTTLRHRAQLVRGGGPAVPLDLELHYTSLDPFAVRIVLRTDGASVHWSLSRDSLLLGLRRLEGIGDVAVWPLREADGHGWLRIRLGPLGSGAVFQTEQDVVAGWLDVTQQLVPLGGESDYLDWDGFLTPLLGQD